MLFKILEKRFCLNDIAALTKYLSMKLTKNVKVGQFLVSVAIQSPYLIHSVYSDDELL